MHTVLPNKGEEGEMYERDYFSGGQRDAAVSADEGNFEAAAAGV